MKTSLLDAAGALDGDGRCCLGVINDPILLHRVAYVCLLSFVRGIMIPRSNPSSCHGVTVPFVERGKRSDQTRARGVLKPTTD